MIYEVANSGKSSDAKVTCSAYQRKGIEPVVSRVISVSTGADGKLHIRVDTGDNKGHDVRIAIPIPTVLEFLPLMIAKKAEYDSENLTHRIQQAGFREARLTKENAHLRRQLAIAEQKRKDAEAALSQAK
jgi:hypothetical protein